VEVDLDSMRQDMRLTASVAHAQKLLEPPVEDLDLLL